MRACVGAFLRKWADRIDPAGAPRWIGRSFTFEHKRGFVLHENDQRGCPLWYLGEADYARAHTEAETEHMIVDWQNKTARFGR